jgi:hypothetical protein
MLILKYCVLFGCALVLLAMAVFIIRSHSFIRRKKGGNLNASEAIYGVGLLLGAVLVVAPALQTIATGFDISEQFYANKFLSTLVTSGSLITVSGMAIFIMLLLTARAMSTLFFFKRKPLIEFDANNLPYALFRAGLLLSLTYLLSPFYQPLFQHLLPVIATPFYR